MEETFPQHRMLYECNIELMLRITQSVLPYMKCLKKLQTYMKQKFKKQ
jgi:hypothetical protein